MEIRVTLTPGSTVEQLLGLRQDPVYLVPIPNQGRDHRLVVEISAGEPPLRRDNNAELVFGQGSSFAQDITG